MSLQEYFCPAYKVLGHVGGAKSDGDDLMISYSRSARSKAKICQYSMLFFACEEVAVCDNAEAVFFTAPELGILRVFGEITLS
jgi:hypothetical protein